MEKPDTRIAHLALAQGVLWNTLIMVAKVRTLWDLAKKHLPDVFALFETYDEAIGTFREDRVLDSIYSVMPVCDFSSELLQNVSERLAVVALDGIFWSDWGRPERIVATLLKIGRAPAFSLDCLVPSPIAASQDIRDLSASTA